MTTLRTKFVLDMVDRITSPIRAITSSYTANMKRMQDSTKRLRDALNTTGRAINDFGKGFSLKISAPIALAGGLAVKTAASIESMMASLKTVTGSKAAANSAMAEITKFATSTPFQLTEVLQSFIKLKALGLDPSMDSLRSYGNTSSAMGKSLDQFIEAVADASTGEFERLKEFGIKAKQQGKSVTFTFQGVKTKIKNDAESIQKYLRDIGDVQFAGAMAEQMNTLNGITANLKDSVEASFGKIGNQIIETTSLKRLITGLSSAISSLTDRFLAMPAGVRDTIVVLGIVLALLGPIIMGIGQLVIGIGGLILGFSYVAPVLIAAAAGIKAFGLALLTTPVGWFALAVAGIAGGAYLIYKNWNPLKEWFAGFWASVTDKFSTAVQSIMKILSPLITALKWVANPLGNIRGNIAGGGYATPLAPSGSKMAPSAPSVALTGPRAQKVDTGGTLNIKIDGQGNPSVLRAEPNDPRMGYTVDSGILMGGAF